MFPININNNTSKTTRLTTKLPTKLLNLWILNVHWLRTKSISTLSKVHQTPDVLIVIVQSTSTLKKMDNLLIVVSTALRNT